MGTGYPDAHQGGDPSDWLWQLVDSYDIGLLDEGLSKPEANLALNDLAWDLPATAEVAVGAGALQLAGARTTERDSRHRRQRRSRRDRTRRGRIGAIFVVAVFVVAGAAAVWALSRRHSHAATLQADVVTRTPPLSAATATDALTPGPQPNPATPAIAATPAPNGTQVAQAAGPPVAQPLQRSRQAVIPAGQQQTPAPAGPAVQVAAASPHDTVAPTNSGWAFFNGDTAPSTNPPLVTTTTTRPPATTTTTRPPVTTTTTLPSPTTTTKPAP